MNAVPTKDENKRDSGSSGGWATAGIIVGVGALVGAAAYFFSNRNDTACGSSEQRQSNYRNRTKSLEACSFCLKEVYESSEEDDTFQPQTLPCGHLFHKTCINHWITLGNKHCPNCRAPIR